MKALTKKKWLLEIARWLRVLAKSPLLLLLAVWGGNALLLLAGKGALLVDTHDIAAINLPSIILVGTVYVLFNAAATWVEILADGIVDNDGPRIVLPGDQNQRQKGG